MWGYSHMYVMRSPGFSWLGLFPFFIFLGVILLIWAIARHKSDNAEEPEDNGSALEILKKRYAKGELTKKEFLEMKKDIS